MSKVCVSCYLDDKPKYLHQCRNWLMSLKWLDTHKKADILVHYNPTISTEIIAYFTWLGAKMVPCPAFGSGTGNDVYCNKVQQLFSPSIKKYEHVVLADLDIIFLECPTLLAGGEKILGKAAFSASIGTDKIQTILRQHNVNTPIRVSRSEFSIEADILSSHYNGGLYMIPGKYISVFAQAWAKWAKFWLGRKDLLKEALFTSDEHAFAAAIYELNIPHGRLPAGANFHTNINKNRALRYKPHKLSSLHYHARIDGNGFLVPKGIEWIDQHIHRANKRIIFALNVHRDGFNNAQKFLSPQKAYPDQHLAPRMSAAI